MEKRIILEGKEKVIDKIIRENKIRVARGDVKFIDESDDKNIGEGGQESSRRGRKPKQPEC